MFHKGKGRNDWKGGGKKFGGPKKWERGSGANFAMHPATCSECGKPCEVPFKPTGKRPVLCQACFRKDGDTGSDRPAYGGRSQNRSGGFGFDDARPAPRSAGTDVSAQLREINEKLDRIIEALED